MKDKKQTNKQTGKKLYSKRRSTMQFQCACLVCNGYKVCKTVVGN